jgi:4-amino-4-deoxy-L-arabinose transferase-like glycosyltransferase
VTRRWAYPLVALVCAVPRIVVLVHEGSSIVYGGVEKSATFAQVFVENGTYGFIPGEPSEYTQPLYGFFLIPLEWAFGRHSWLGIGIPQIVVAVVVAWLVYEIAARFVGSRWAVLAAVLTTLHPYLVWHDVHVNREIIDQLCAAGLVLLTLLVAERATWWLAGALGIVAGLALLGNTRLVLIPLLCVAYLAVRRVPVPLLAVVLIGAALPVVPWLVRNDVNVGCVTLTTDGRSLWKANNPQTYHLLATHQWIDNVRRDSPRPPHPGYYTPEEARGFYDRTAGKTILHPDECLAMNFYEHLAWQWVEHHPGAKLKLTALSEQLFWQPSVIETGGSSGGFGKQVAEPAYMIALYLLAALGLFVVARTFAWLALALFAYESLWAGIFVGATRYRVAFDFLFAVLATCAIAWLWERKRA